MEIWRLLSPFQTQCPTQVPLIMAWEPGSRPYPGKKGTWVWNSQHRSAAAGGDVTTVIPKMVAATTGSSATIPCCNT